MSALDPPEPPEPVDPFHNPDQPEPPPIQTFDTWELSKAITKLREAVRAGRECRLAPSEAIAALQYILQVGPPKQPPPQIPPTD